MLASSAFLASAAATLPLQDAILSGSTQGAEDSAVSSATKMWTAQAQSATPVDAMKHIQKAWDTPRAAKVFEKILTDDSNTQTDTARLRSAATPHAGDWLHAPPITAVGLRLSDEAIRIAVGFRLGSRTCQPHSYVCGAMVDAKGLHGLSCKRTLEKCTAADQTCVNELYYLEIRQESAVSGCQGTSWFVTVERKKIGWGYDDPMDEREAVGLGRDHPRYVYELILARHRRERQQRQTERRKTKRQSTQIWPRRTISYQSQLRQVVPGMNWLCSSSRC